MSASDPRSNLTTDQLLRLGQFDRTLADALDDAIYNGGGGGGGVVPYFQHYMATGSEGQSFMVPLSDAQPDGDYEVSYFNTETADAEIPPAIMCPNDEGDRLDSSFRVEVSAPLRAGDVHVFILVRLP